MKKIIILSFIIPMLWSCINEGPDQSNSYVYFIVPSEYVLDQLDVRTKENCIMFAPVLDNDLFEKNINSNEQNQSFTKWSQSLLRDKPGYFGDNVMRYSTSYLSHGINITSDVSLFGEGPGADISNHFIIVNGPDYPNSICGDLLKSKDYNLVFEGGTGHSLPTELDEYFFDELVLSCVETRSKDLYYCIKFKDNPSIPSQGAEITLTLPVKEDLVFSAFHSTGEFNPEMISQRERILTGTVRFMP